MQRKMKTCVLLVALIIICVLALSAIDFRFGPDFRLDSKVIDPRQPGFERNNFLFRDYNSQTDIKEVLKYIMPEGTSRDEIERIMTLQGDDVIKRRITDGSTLGMEKIIPKGEYIITYFLKAKERCWTSVGSGKKPYRLDFVFDGSGKSKTTSFYLACY